MYVWACLRFGCFDARARVGEFGLACVCVCLFGCLSASARALVCLRLLVCSFDCWHVYVFARVFVLVCLLVRVCPRVGEFGVACVSVSVCLPVCLPLCARVCVCLLARLLV